MTTAAAQAPLRARRARSVPLAAPGRLLRLELRRNVMPWTLPLLAALFLVATYRPAMANPPLWNLRGAMLQTRTMLAFAPVLAGVAAWAGSREGRRGTADLVGAAGLPRWTGRLAAWAAVTCWAEASYLAGAAVVYGVTAHQAVWGGPPLWPVAVGAATAAAACAIGFAAGALAPSRFTAPLAAVTVFLALGAGAIAIQHGSRATYSQIWPLNVQGPFPIDSYGVFYHEVPDLAIAQLMFVGGLGLAAMGTLGLPAISGGRWLRAASGSRWLHCAAAAVMIAGLGAAGTAVGLAGTARLEANGIAIPALHDAASDRPVPYTPVCTRAAIPVCLHPAYRAYLPEVNEALAPVLQELASLPGAPQRVTQVAVTSVQQAPSNGISFGGPVLGGGLLDLPLSGESLLGEGTTAAQFVAELRGQLLFVLNAFVGAPGPQAVPGSGVSLAPQTPGEAAQFAVAMALAEDAGLLTQYQAPGSAPGGRAGPPGSPGTSPAGAGKAAAGNSSGPGPAGAATRRFADLPAPARHAWLATHLTALRAAQITLSEIP